MCLFFGGTWSFWIGEALRGNWTRPLAHRCHGWGVTQQSEQEHWETRAPVKEQGKLKVNIRWFVPVTMPFPHGRAQNIKAKGRGKTAKRRTIPSSQPITVITRYLEEEKTLQKGTIINATKEELGSCGLNHWFCASSPFYVTISSHCELLHLHLVRNMF